MVQKSGDTVRHYSALAAHALFIAAFEIDAAPVGAQLWNASDATLPVDSPESMAALLTICTKAGFEGAATQRKLETYVCAVVDQLARKRPTVASYGALRSSESPGDPLRNDPDFAKAARSLLMVKADTKSRWWATGALAEALSEKKQSDYGSALGELKTACGRTS